MSNEGKHFTIDFVDPLFAVAIHIGFTHWFIDQPWFRDWRPPLGSHEWFSSATFFLGFLTILLSWVGYHQSVRTKPIKGYWRFLIDVVLVATYALLLVKASHLQAVLFLLFVIYGLYGLWDLAKVFEYPEKFTGATHGHRYRREYVTVLFFVVFGLLALAARSYASSPTQLGQSFADWLLLTLSLVCTVLYRVWKAIPFLATLGRVGLHGLESDQEP